MNSARIKPALQLAAAIALAAALTSGCTTNDGTGSDTSSDVIDAADDIRNDADTASFDTDSGEQDTAETTGDDNKTEVSNQDSEIAYDSDSTIDNDEPSDQDSVELPEYEEPAARVLFDLLASQAESPFPSNHYIKKDDGTILIDAQGHNNSSLYLIEMDVPMYTRDAARMKGFALYSSLVFMTSTAVDPATLPADGAASIADGSAVRLYRIDGGRSELLPIRCVFKTYEETRPFHMTVCRPLYTFAPDATYLFVVTDALKDVDGNAFAKSKGFMQALGKARIEGDADQTRVAQMLATGTETGAALDAVTGLDGVAGASVFTTGHPNTEMHDLMALFNDGASPVAVDYVPDQEQDGSMKFYSGPSFPRCSMPSDMAFGIHGVFHAAEFRNADGLFERDGTGFKTFDSEDIPFHLMVPDGEGPFPVVIAQHGVSSDEGAMCNVARALVRRDIAVLRFLWPEHGGTSQRGNGTTDFLDVLNPARIGYNFMQSASEIGSAVLLLDKLSADLAGYTVPGPTQGAILDTSRIGYVGTSLASIIGMLYLPFSDRIDVMVSNVGGLGMSHLVEQFVDLYFGGMFIGKAVTNLADHIVATGDGVSNAGRILKDPVEWASGPKYLLGQEVIGDDVVCNASTEVMARNVGLKLVNPVAVPIEGIESADPATLTSGLYQIVGGNHHEFTSSPGDPLNDAVREQAYHFLETGLKNGVPEIVVYPVD